MLYAREARVKAKLVHMKNPKMIELFKKIGIEADLGNTSFNFFDYEDEISTAEEETIEALGYKISWNNTCSWYEISW